MKSSTALLLTLILSGCEPGESNEDPSAETAAKVAGIQDVLNLGEPLTSKENLNTLYETAVNDFALYEAGRKESANRVYRLSQKIKEIETYTDDDLVFIAPDPDQFCGVDRRTELGSRLLNKGDSTKDYPNIQDVGVFRLKISDSKRRMQITLAWLQTISLTWTFLYEIDDTGKLKFVKGIVYGCSSPDNNWIDDQSDPMNTMGNQIREQD